MTPSVINVKRDYRWRDKGAIAPERGPARKLANFLTAVVAHASDFDRTDDAPGPLCFKCRKRDQRAFELNRNPLP